MTTAGSMDALEAAKAAKAAAVPPTQHYLAAKAEILNRRKPATDRSRHAAEHHRNPA
jgi:hypothetical protein